MNSRPLTRRALLETSVATVMGFGLTGALGPFARSAARPSRLGERKTKHVVLIAFAGGVRTRETFGQPANVPNLVRMAEDGVLYTRARTANLGHYGAAQSLFTGISEARGIRENARGTDPTLFEYVRKDLALPASEVWIATSGGAQQANYSHGLHADYGPEFGANTLDGDGIFNREFEELLQKYGRPRKLDDAEAAVLAQLRGSIGADSPGQAGATSAAASAVVENYILEELTRGTSDLRGQNASDAKALRVARNLVSVFRPTLTAVVLQDADVAHGSFNAYQEVIRQNDAMVGELWAAVQADPELADSTAFVVLPEFGRDADLNPRRGLDHGDGSDDLNYVAALCWGPDFRRGKTVESEVRAIDVCPTVCGLLGADARLARGKQLPGLFA